MTLRLYYHPFSSFCQKVLIALYEREVPFERVVVDLGDPEHRAALERLWPMGKFPVLRDEARGVTIPESSLIVEYLDRTRRGGTTLVPEEPDAALKVRLLDRFFDNYVELPLQYVVKEQFRPLDARDPYGVEEAKALLSKAYVYLEDALAEGGGEWAVGDAFSLADCSAAPALFYANIVEPFERHACLSAYYARLLARASFARAVDEARPYRPLFPLPWPESY
jgi:glutathione S-transferase